MTNPNSSQNRAYGPDVSHFWPVLNWDRLAASGASFFAAKASDGNANVDPMFLIHRQGFRSRLSGFSLAVWYHFAREPGCPMGGGQADAQANRFADLVGDMPADERLCLDFEPGGFNPAWEFQQHTDWVNLFLQTLDARTKSKLILYTSLNAWSTAGMTAPPTTECDLWQPRYSQAMVEPKPLWKAWTLWQWTDGRAVVNQVPGVGACDCNFFAGSADELRTYAAGTADKTASSDQE